MNIILVFLIVFLNTSQFYMPSTKKYLVFWNVGQGQWVSRIFPEKCIHFDVGGEFFAFQSIYRKLVYHCRDKTNIILVSHWDWDHTLNISNLVKKFSKVCVAHSPVYGQHKKFVRKLTELKIETCTLDLKTDYSKWSPRVYSQTNESSSVFVTDRVLISGDSTSNQEKIWKSEIDLTKMDIFVLGHHGSKSSNSKLLLNSWPELNMAIASARSAVYNHPHPSVKIRLKEFNISLVQTEKWGNIWIEL